MNKLSKEGYYIWTGLIVAFAIRAVFSFTTNIMAFPDCQEYNNAALQILNFTYPKTGFFRAPGYPFFLAILYKISAQNYLWVKIIQALMGTLTCYFIMNIGQKMFNKKTGFIAFLLTAINPFFIYWTGFLLSETFFAFLFIFSVLALILFDRTNLKRYLILCAFLLAFSALTRPIAVLFVPFLLLYLFFKLKKDYSSRLKDLAIFGICFICVIAPWTLRNYLVYKDFILINNYGGLMVLGANNKYLIKLFDAKTKEEFTQNNKEFYNYLGRSMEGAENLSNSEMQKKLFKLAFNYIKDNPNEWLYLRWRNFLEFWRPGVRPMLFPRSIFIVSLLYLIPIMLLGIFEFIRQFFKRDLRSSDKLLLFIILIVGSSHILLGATEIRFRIPIIDPFLIIFAAHFLYLFFGRFNAYSKKIV